MLDQQLVIKRELDIKGESKPIYHGILTMYAVIKTGGKQYKVAAGDKIKVEQMLADIGAEVTLDHVLSVGAGDSITIGTPTVTGASVTATVLSFGRHDKVRIFKMRRRKHYQKRQGHRQNYIELFISSINSAQGVLASAGAPAVKATSIPAGVEAKVTETVTYRVLSDEEAAKIKATEGENLKTYVADDLVKIEGIGPKIKELLNNDGIFTFQQLADTSVDRLKDILKAAGARYAAHDPSTWPEQSALAAKGDWEAFKKLTDELDGGKRK